MKRFTMLIAATALLGAAAGASAKVLAASTYVPNFSFSTPTAFVPIGGTIAAPKTELKVNAATQGWHLLTFSADCDVVTPSLGWMDIDVQINGMAQAPTVGSADVFCAGRIPNAFGGWTRPAITMAVWLNEGPNTVRVLARLTNASQGWFDGVSLLVHP